MGDIELQLFSERLKELRLSLNMTQKDFADKIDVTAAALSAYENNQKNPSIAVAKRIAETFKISLDWLCGISDQKKLNKKIETYADLIRIINQILETDYLSVNFRIVEAVGSNPICSMLETLDFSRVFLFISVEDFKYFLLFGYYLGTTQYISRAVRSVALVQVSLNRRAPVPFMPSLRTRSSYRNGRSRLLLDGFRSSRRAVF